MYNSLKKRVIKACIRMCILLTIALHNTTLFKILFVFCFFVFFLMKMCKAPQCPYFWLESISNHAHNIIVFVFCNYFEEYNHFFIACEKNVQFWNSFKKCLYVLTRIHFNLSLENIIYGRNIDKINCASVNFLFIVAPFSVYKARIRYNETIIFSPI